jgi:GDP-L-fucose synthase
MTIVVAGSTGLVGSAIVRHFENKGFQTVGINRSVVNLFDKKATSDFILKTKPTVIIDAAARVGGIAANNHQPVEFLTENLLIQNNLMQAAHKAEVPKFVFLGSSCIYPKFTVQPIKEEYLLSGLLEPTNEAYAVAKIAGVKICENYNRQYKLNYKSLMPCNTFGPNDNYNLFSSHFFPALISKIMQAVKNNKKYICLLGNGKTQRELIYVDDVADAVIFFLFKKTKDFLINIGTEREMTIEQYAKLQKKC